MLQLAVPAKNCYLVIIAALSGLMSAHWSCIKVLFEDSRQHISITPILEKKIQNPV